MGSYVVPPFQPYGRPRGPVFKVPPADVDWIEWVSAVCEVTEDCPAPFGLYDDEPSVTSRGGVFYPLSREIRIYSNAERFRYGKAS
jgi:hypothetical protein